MHFNTACATSLTSTKFCVLSPVPRMDNNIINYCVNHKCKLIYISGTSVYGNDDKGLLTEHRIYFLFLFQNFSFHKYTLN